MATRAEVEVLPTREALMEAAAARFVSAAGAAIRASGRFVVALAGGSTPKALYALLAGAPWAGRVDWSRVHVFWGDERCVPPDDPASNYRMTRETLLAHTRSRRSARGRPRSSSPGTTCWPACSRRARRSGRPAES